MQSVIHWRPFEGGFAFSILLMTIVGCGEQSVKRLPPKISAQKWQSFSDEQRWEEIVKTAVPDSLESTDAGIGYWEDVWSLTSRKFNSGLAKNQREWAEHFVAQFGKHGPEADIRWMMCDWHATIPHAVAGNRDPVNRRIVSKTRSNRAAIISEFITRRLVADADFRKRYHHVVWYSDQFYPFADIAIATLDDFDWDLNDAPQYWLYGRNLVLLCHVFGLEDVLQDASPENLETVYGAFQQRREEQRQELIDSGQSVTSSGMTFVEEVRPKQHFDRPFPDWDETCPTKPSVKFLRDHRRLF